ncbi:hypothetical protein [Saccharolobus caldissimus]|uniref:Uncharacterized protein n=1 Tax=Saccharolobus caldissimus TaxID=1702097 RepID=A0AAQ4CTB5_9CREN|nr:hypothetical protein [Saccharolobus caldissimus]BDB99046.1 hypothetical protein SACC_20630 [Saccharolobus caldissimus]
MSFWDYYRMVEQGTLVNFEEFKQNSELKEKVKEGIKGMLKILTSEISTIIKFNSYEEAVWQLLRLNIISASLAQELLDIFPVINNIENADDNILYSMLVRIMEDIEETLIKISEYKGKISNSNSLQV